MTSPAIATGDTRANTAFALDPLATTTVGELPTDSGSPSEIAASQTMDTFETAELCWSPEMNMSLGAPVRIRTPLERIARTDDERQLLTQLGALASDPRAPGTDAARVLEQQLTPGELNAFLERVSTNDEARESMMALLGEAGAIQHIAGAPASGGGALEPPATNGVANPMPWTPESVRGFMHDYNVGEATRYRDDYNAYHSRYGAAVREATDPFTLRALGPPQDSSERSPARSWGERERREVERSLSATRDSFGLHAEVTNRLHAMANDARPFEFAVSADMAVKVAGRSVFEGEAESSNIERFAIANDLEEGTYNQSIDDPTDTFVMNVPVSKILLVPGVDVDIAGGVNLSEGEVYHRVEVGRKLGALSVEGGVNVHLKIGPEFRDLDGPSFWQLDEAALLDRYMELAEPR